MKRLILFFCVLFLVTELSAQEISFRFGFLNVQGLNDEVGSLAEYRLNIINEDFLRREEYWYQLTPILQGESSYNWTFDGSIGIKIGELFLTGEASYLMCERANAGIAESKDGTLRWVKFWGGSSVGPAPDISQPMSKSPIRWRVSDQFNQLRAELRLLGLSVVPISVGMRYENTDYSDMITTLTRFYLPLDFSIYWDNKVNIHSNGNVTNVSCGPIVRLDMPVVALARFQLDAALSLGFMRTTRTFSGEFRDIDDALAWDVLSTAWRKYQYDGMLQGGHKDALWTGALDLEFNLSYDAGKFEPSIFGKISQRTEQAIAFTFQKPWTPNSGCWWEKKVGTINLFEVGFGVGVRL